jgi:RimJ/RimL family protein N-acetyltransferase
LAIVPTRDVFASVETRTELSFRPAAIADARLYAQLSALRRPDEPEDPEVVAYYWANPTPGFNVERFIVESGGRPVGFAWHEERPAEDDPERIGDVGAWFIPEALSAENLSTAHRHVDELSRGTGTLVFTTDIWEDEDLTIEVLEALDFRRDRLSRASELDLFENRDRLLLEAARSAALMRELGIECRAVADDPDPDIWSHCHEAQAVAAADMPRTEAYIPPTFAQFDNWYSGPDASSRWFFVAKAGDRVVATSDLRFPPVRGNVWTGFTGVIPEFRGKGVARGVKMAILKQAIEQNVPRVRTDNDEENAPMLHINEELGYQPIPGVLTYRKPA